MEKKYYLCVELEINGEKRVEKLIEADFLTLQRYTSYCFNKDAMLKFMPNDEFFSCSGFIAKFLSNDNPYNYDPFSIRTKPDLKAEKEVMLYNKDQSLLLIDSEEIVDSIRNCYPFKADDYDKKTYSKETEEFYKKLYEFREKCGRADKDKIDKKITEFTDEKLDPDKYGYDRRYLNIINERWAVLGLSYLSLKEFIKIIEKDSKRKIELYKFLKEYNSNLIPKLEPADYKRRLEFFDSRIKYSIYQLKRDIKGSLSTLNKEENLGYKLKDIEFINEEYEKSGLANEYFKEVLTLTDKKQVLEDELSIAKDEEIKEKIENQLAELDLKLNQIEKNRVIKADSGEVNYNLNNEDLNYINGEEKEDIKK